MTRRLITVFTTSCPEPGLPRNKTVNRLHKPMFRSVPDSLSPDEIRARNISSDCKAQGSSTSQTGPDLKPLLTVLKSIRSLAPRLQLGLRIGTGFKKES
jgi:hypothetical protein